MANNEEIRQDIVINETDNGSIDRTTSKLEKQNKELESISKKFTGKSITNSLSYGTLLSGVNRGKDYEVKKAKEQKDYNALMAKARAEQAKKEAVQRKQTLKQQQQQEEQAAKASAARLDAVTGSLQRLQKSLDFTNLIFKVKALSMAFQGVMSIAESGTQIVEENNLFYNQLTNVSKEYGDLEKSATRYYEKAIEYQNKLYEATHLNRVENMKSQGTFFQLFNAQNVGEDLSYRLSESLSNAAIDLSSLFNIDYDQMVEKLKSGIIGNSRPLRELGIDVTEGTMQGILDNLGIDATVEQLTFAEKEVLRYMTILDQVGYAQGDFTNTFMQSANQIRVFQNELTTVGQMIGTIFNKLLGNVLYVARGIIMAVEEILTALGSLIGVDWSDTGSTRPLASLGEEVDDVSAGIGGATAKAKEFKKQLMSFDEIHNITPPDSSSGGGGGGVGGLSGLLNSDLTNSIKDWTSNFEKIDDRAKSIKDSILKALGFTRDINGNLKWSITDFWNNIGVWGQNIIRVIQGIMAFKLGVKILEMIGNAKKLIGLLTNNPIKGSGLEVGLTSLGDFFRNIGKNISTMWKDWQNGSANAHGSVTRLATAFGGILSTIGALTYIFQDIKQVLDGTADIADMFPAIIARIVQGIAGVAAAVLAVKTTISPIYGIISLIVSAVAGWVASIFEVNAAEAKQEGTIANTTKKVKEATEERKKYNEQLAETKKSTLKEIDEGKSTLSYYGRLKDELMTLVDANGKIKEGNESRVKFILGKLKEGLGTEYKLNGDIIEQYKDYCKQLDEAIQKKTTEIYIKAYQDDITEAIKRSNDQQKKLNQATDNYNKVVNDPEFQKIINKYEELKGKLAEAGYEYKETGNKATDFKNVCGKIKEANWSGEIDGQRVNLEKLQGAYADVTWGVDLYQQILEGFESNIQNEYNEATKAIVDDNQLIMAYEDLLAANEENNTDKITAAKVKLTEAYKQQGEEDQTTVETQLSNMIDATNRYIDRQKQQGKEITADRKKAMDESVRITANSLTEQTKTVHTLTPEEVKAWNDLSSYSHDIYVEQISKLDPETQVLLDSLTGNVKAEEQSYWNAWSEIAANAKDKFKENIKSLPQDQQTTLLAGISTVKGCEQATVEAYGQLSDEGKIEYLGKIKDLPEEQRKKILEMLGEFGKQEGTAGTAAKELADTIQKAINGEELKIGDQQVKVDGKAIDDKIKGAIGTVTVPIKGKYQATWHWVPKQDGSGEYEQRYFARGGRPQKGQIFIAREAGAELVGNIGGSTGVMNNMQIIAAVAKGVSSAVANVLHDGFTVSIPQDNTVSNVQEQLVNEMRISNEYASQEFKQARPSVSSKYGFTTNGVVGSGTQGLVQMLAQAVEYGMNNANVNVKVEATTDTGVVIKQVSEAMNDYVNQTGQLPFAIPM